MSKGWCGIRGGLDLGIDNPTEKNKFVHELLSNFFEDRKVCPKCGGMRVIFTKKRLPKSRNAIENIKIRDIPELERHKELLSQAEGQGLPLSDLIRIVLSTELEGLKLCPKCKGKVFLKKRKTK